MINWKWPKKPGNNLLPGYAIVWRCIWWLPIVISVGLAAIFIGIATLSVEEGMEVWTDHL